MKIFQACLKKWDHQFRSKGASQIAAFKVPGSWWYLQKVEEDDVSILNNPNQIIKCSVNHLEMDRPNMQIIYVKS